MLVHMPAVAAINTIATMTHNATTDALFRRNSRHESIQGFDAGFSSSLSEMGFAPSATAMLLKISLFP
jgi:hypothetical protein